MFFTQRRNEREGIFGCFWTDWFVFVPWTANGRINLKAAIGTTDYTDFTDIKGIINKAAFTCEVIEKLPDFLHNSLYPCYLCNPWFVSAAVFRLICYVPILCVQTTAKQPKYPNPFFVTFYLPRKKTAMILKTAAETNHGLHR